MVSLTSWQRITALTYDIGVLHGETDKDVSVLSCVTALNWPDSQETTQTTLYRSLLMLNF